MRLSEAIREGAKRHKPSSVGWTERDSETKELRTCALYAACIEIGMYNNNGDTVVTDPARFSFGVDGRTGMLSRHVMYPMEWTGLLNKISTAPCEHARIGDVESNIWHLHDVHKMSREAVAEWVETLENKIDAEAKVTSPAPAPQQTPESPRVDLGECAALGSPKHEPAVV
jgi:hypothetical protein